MKKNLKKGFTLTELVVVIVIIGILASVLIPTLTSYITRSRKSAAEQEANARLQEVAAYILDGDNENWFVWNEFVKGSDIAIESAHNYWVYFEKGKLNQSRTATGAPTAGTITTLSFSGDTYTVVLKESDETYFVGKLFTDASHETAYAAEKTGFTVKTSGVIAFTPGA